ncbi:MAG: Glycosyl hydrolase family 20, catalytic domain [Lentisphaerae bacterium ADurb.Bin082]|nr:MAG: Glycosyl hydrolase family 20, catalytic domain [Lentisphaerae bacterium ADurb.Bin082]
MKAKIFFAVMILLGTLFSLSAAETEVVLYEAGRANSFDFACSTCTWIEGSNAKPALALVERGGEPWLQVNSEGDSGQGRAVMSMKEQFSALVPEDTVARGVAITIDYPRDDFKKLPIILYFKDKRTFTHHLPLEKGVKTYYFDKGYTRTGIPQTWSELQTVVLTVVANFPEFHLKKMAIQLHPKQTSEKWVEIIRNRKVAEVLPGQGSTALDFGHDSPFQVKVGYDQENLYIDSEAAFPERPKATFLPGDKTGSVWADELTEYFFSAWNDNLKYIQFVTNMNGATWDSITDFDLTAAAVIRKTDDWQLGHDKKISWENSKWKTNAVFPFAELKFNLSEQRFMGFQIAQGYGRDRGDKYVTRVWDESKRFPETTNFGVLVFNQQPFGSGAITLPQKLLATTDQDSEKIDFRLSITATDFAAGNYTLRKYVAAARNSFTELPAEKITLTGEKQSIDAHFTDCVNLNGVYSLYLALENDKGSQRLVAVNFDNTKPLISMFGKPVFCPEPKKVVWKDGVFLAGQNSQLSLAANASARTKKTAEIFAEKLLGFAGQYRIQEGTDSGIALRVAPTASFDGKKQSLQPEGYCLQVTPEKVVITGADEPGLYYGCITFMQMLRQPMKRQNDAPVQCAEILDSPDLERRFTNLLHPWQFYGKEFKENRTIDYLIDWVDKYVAGTKQNLFSVDIASLVQYKRRPEFNSTNCLYSLDDLGKLAQYCREHFIEFVPRWQTGGHANWWLLHVHPELREKGYRNTADVTHLEHNKIVFDCMLDVIEATQCKFLNVGGDEWWHSPHPDESPDELLRGKTRAQAFLDFHIAVMAFARENHVEVMMHGDMLDPYHNGVRYDLHKIIDDMPKDLIILPWAGGNVDRMIMYFIDKGFRTWPNPTGVWFPNRSRRQIGGFGNSIYSFSSSLQMGSAARANYANNLLRGAEYAWNAYSDSGKNLTEAISSGLLPALMEQFAEPAIPGGSQEVLPVPLRQAFNTDFNQLLLKKEPGKYVGRAQSVKLPVGQINAGNMPMLLNDGKLNCIRIGKDESVSLPLNSKYASLLFLHTVRTDEEFLKKHASQLSWRPWIYGRPAGDYVVNYADGTTSLIPLRLDDNINFAGIKPELRSCLNCRYIMPLEDANGNYQFLYQHEWVNPYPEKEIKSVVLNQTVVDFDLLLFAISGRKLKQ